jgi:ribosomal RNA-processing protein 12
MSIYFSQLANIMTPPSPHPQNIARILGTQLGQRKEIRLDILSGLRHLVSRNLEHAERRAELGRYAKNFLPILFNLYTSRPAGAEEAGQRLAALGKTIITTA